MMIIDNDYKIAAASLTNTTDTKTEIHIPPNYATKDTIVTIYIMAVNINNSKEFEFSSLNDIPNM